MADAVRYVVTSGPLPDPGPNFAGQLRVDRDDGAAYYCLPLTSGWTWVRADTNGIDLSGYAPVGHTHDDRYYTEPETDSLLAGKASTSHTHDDRYYTETETNSLLAGKADTSHTHDDRYYTESETNTLLAGKSDTSHTHTLDSLSDVVATSPTTSQVLTWNGSVWTNQSAASGQAAPVLLASPRSGTYYTFPGLVAGYGASTMTTNPDPATTYYFPIFVPRSGTLNGLGVIRQDTTAGNVAVKLALFAMDPTSYAWSTPPIREGEVTTTSGNPIAQYVTVTNYAITRGWYWVGIKVASALGLRSDDVALIAPNSVSYPWMDRTAGLRHVGTAYATPWAASSGTGTWQDTHDAYRVLLRIAV